MCLYPQHRVNALDLAQRLDEEIIAVGDVGMGAHVIIMIGGRAVGKQTAILIAKVDTMVDQAVQQWTIRPP